MKKYIFILLLTVTLFIPTTSKSCYWGPYAEDLRVYIFNPKTYGNYGLEAFYYSSDFYFTPNNYYSDVEVAPVIPDENIDEWFLYLKKNTDKQSIYKFLYTSTKEDMKKLVNGQLDEWEELYQNKMNSYLKKNGRNDILKYILFAKETETILSEQNLWSDTGLNSDSLKMFTELAKTQFAQTKDEFLKQRYAYQVILLLRYAEKNTEAIKLYYEFFDKLTENISVIKYWALNHVAYCEELIGKKEESQLNFIRVFNNCNDKKFYANNRIINKYVGSLLKKNISEKDKYYIETYLQFRNPGKSLKELKKLSLQNPDNELYTALLVRELNKIEDWLLTRKYTGQQPAILYWIEPRKDITENYESDFEYLKEYIEFLEKDIYTKVKDKGKIELLLAHLYFLAENPQQAKKYIEIAQNNIQTKNEQIQLRYTRILINLQSEKEYNEKFEQILWKDLNWLILDKSNNYKDNRNFANLIFAIHHAYHIKKMYAKAAMFLHYDITRKERWQTRWWDFESAFFYLDSFSGTPEVEKFVELIKKNDKTNMEKFLLGDTELDLRYYDLLGTIELRNNNLAKASEYFKKLPSDFWFSQYYYSEYLTTNPFSSEKAKPEYLFENDSLYADKSYFLYCLVEQLNKYETAQGEQKAEEAILLSNCYFNMSYYGTHWHYCCYGNSSTQEGLLAVGNNNVVNDNYWKCTKAFEYLDKALSLTSDTQRKAKINYIKASIFNLVNYDYETGKHKEKNIYAKELQDNYEDQYEQYLMECPGLEFF